MAPSDAPLLFRLPRRLRELRDVRHGRPLRRRVPRQLLGEHYGRCDDVQSMRKRVEPCWIDIDISVRVQSWLRE